MQKHSSSNKHPKGMARREQPQRSIAVGSYLFLAAHSEYCFHGFFSVNLPSRDARSKVSWRGVFSALEGEIEPLLSLLAQPFLVVT